LTAENFLAVTGACMMTPREEFERVGGFSATFPMNYNDVDYCLKLASADFESSSRSTDVEDWEKDQFRARWLPITPTPTHT
jgi:O-antigen biosynthesis protein